MDAVLSYVNSFSMPLRLGLFAVFAVITHLSVMLVRHLVWYLFLGQRAKQHQKMRSVITLATSALVFSLYFFAIGLILREFGVSLTAYLASASVVGLAIGFGSQGIVQDVVTGLTFIFSDLIDVDDLVEVSGQTGMVKAITMRFVELENAMGATVFIPNRTINNVINYPRGYLRCVVDVTLSGDARQQDRIEEAALRQMNLVVQQFPGIFITEPSNEGRIHLDAGKDILRIKFRIWPSREKPIEVTFFQELSASLREIDPAYQPWMVAISYEVEKRVRRKREAWLWSRANRSR